MFSSDYILRDHRQTRYECWTPSEGQKTEDGEGGKDAVKTTGSEVKESAGDGDKTKDAGIPDSSQDDSKIWVV